LEKDNQYRAGIVVDDYLSVGVKNTVKHHNDQFMKDVSTDWPMHLDSDINGREFMGMRV
jgi:hypothetical protein